MSPLEKQLRFGWQVRWLWRGLAVAAGLVSATGAATQPLRRGVLERLRAATVFIGVLDPRSGQLRASGSGFLVSPRGEVLTTRHLASVPGELRVVLRSGQPGERRVRAEVSRSDGLCDLALLTTGLRDMPCLRIADSAGLRETEGVVMAGFPLGGLLETGELNPAPSFRTGVITSLRRSRYGGLVWLEISSGAEVGSSGSPVTDADGSVVGMVSEVGGRATVLAVPSRRLVAFGGEDLHLAERDRRALRGWLEDPVEQAQLLYETGRFFEARAALNPLLDARPASLRLLDLQSGIEERLGGIETSLAAYERLLRDYPKDARSAFWSARAEQLTRYRGDGNPRNNFMISAPPRQEVAVVDAGEGRVLETLRRLRLSSYVRYRADGRYAFGRSPSALLAVDLSIPQEATHLRRDHPELGSPDWVSASPTGDVVVAAFSQDEDPAPSSTVVIYQGGDLREVAVHRLPGHFLKGYVAPDGRAVYLVSLVRPEGATGPTARILRLDLTTGQTSVLIEETPVTTWMAFPEGLPAAYLLHPDGRVARLDLATGGVTFTSLGGINDIEAAPTPRQLLMGGRELLIWDAGEERTVQRFPLPFEAYQVGFTPDGAYLFAADGARERVVTIHRESGRPTEIRLTPERPSGPIIAQARQAGRKSTPGSSP